MATIRTRCRPIGLGRSCERVVNTPCARPAQLATRMDSVNVAVGAVEPGENEDLGVDLEVRDCLAHVRVEHERRVGSALVALQWRGFEIDQCRGHTTDRSQLERPGR